MVLLCIILGGLDTPPPPNSSHASALINSSGNYFQLWFGLLADPKLYFDWSFTCATDGSLILMFWCTQALVIVTWMNISKWLLFNCKLGIGLSDVCSCTPLAWFSLMWCIALCFPVKSQYHREHFPCKEFWSTQTPLKLLELTIKWSSFSQLGNR